MSTTKPAETRNQFVYRMNHQFVQAQLANNKWDLSGEDIEAALNFDPPYANFNRARLFRLMGDSFADRTIEELTLNDGIARYVNFSRTVLTGAGFCNANLEGSLFVSANLSGSDFDGAMLDNTDFSNANLRGCYFHPSSIVQATGIMMAGPVGRMGRMIYAYTHDGEIRIQAGCRNANPDNMRRAIDGTYADPELKHHRQNYLDAVKMLEAWGKRELKRVKKTWNF